MIPGKGRGAGFAGSFGYAIGGIRRASRGRNFRVEACFALAAVIIGLALGISALEWAVVVLCIFSVLALECVNEAIEAAIDLTCPEIQPLAKTAKDCAAGAVLLLSAASFIIALLIFVPKIC